MYKDWVNGFVFSFAAGALFREVFYVTGDEKAFIFSIFEIISIFLAVMNLRKL